MERSAEKISDGGELSEELLLNGVLDAAAEEGSSSLNNSTRQPFTSLSQVDADLALARALQQQEHAYLLLHIGNDGSEYDTSGSGSFDYEYVNEGDEEEYVSELPSVQPPLELGLSLGSHAEDEDAQEEEKEEVDGSFYENDEAFARALQEAEHLDASAYIMGFIGVEESDGDDEDESYGSQDAWQDVDPDNMSYEELVALGEAVGTHSKGLKPDVIAALPYSKFVQEDSSSTSTEDPCVICRFEYEDGDVLSTLPCKHHYHADCIKNWLQINKEGFRKAWKPKKVWSFQKVIGQLFFWVVDCNCEQGGHKAMWPPNLQMSSGILAKPMIWREPGFGATDSETFTHILARLVAFINAGH